MKFGFVILQYNAVNETMACVDSIEKHCAGADYEVVLVDNCSPDKSAEIVIKKYQGKEHIHVLLNKENLGFARGNNVGYRYAKQQLKCDFIVMLNNDTMLLDDGFVKAVTHEYDNSGFAVLGPMIITPSGDKTSNPRASGLRSLSYYRLYIIRVYAWMAINYVGLDQWYHKTKRWLLEKVHRGSSTAYKNRRENVVLHGAFWVFSPKFVDSFEGLCDQTFLFMEEELLFLQVSRSNLKTIYTPNIKIFHREDASTQTLKPHRRSRQSFIYKNSIRSTKVLIREMLRQKSSE